jgi:hypothetical protein
MEESISISINNVARQLDACGAAVKIAISEISQR